MNPAPRGLGDDVPIHRLGGGSVANLKLKAAETALVPPGISVLSAGTPEEAAEAVRKQFPRMAPRGRTIVGSTTVGQIRSAGFDVIMNPTKRFPQHARLLHPEGAVGFSDENLQRLSQCFKDRVEF